MTPPSDSGDIVETIGDPLVVIPKPGNHQNHLESCFKILIPRYCNRYACAEHGIVYRDVKSLCYTPETNIALCVNYTPMS